MPHTAALTQAPALLIQSIQALSMHFRLQITEPPNSEVALWLIAGDSLEEQFDSEIIHRILANPPYWSFCWGSGLALAQWIRAHPELVCGKKVLDLGAGSGIVALAATRAGAQLSVACDLDATALLACRANAALNNLKLFYSDQPLAHQDTFDLILAADLLYDADNQVLLDQCRKHARQVLIADSRVRNLQHPTYQKRATLEGLTWPDLGEAAEFREVALYYATGLAP